MNKFIFRWLVANHFGDDLRCDTEEVATGACSSGRNEDCPGKEVRYMRCLLHLFTSSDSSAHNLKCCQLPEYYYLHCQTHDFRYPYLQVGAAKEEHASMNKTGVLLLSVKKQNLSHALHEYC